MSRKYMISIIEKDNATIIVLEGNLSENEKSLIKKAENINNDFNPNIWKKFKCNQHRDTDWKSI